MYTTSISLGGDIELVFTKDGKAIPSNTFVKSKAKNPNGVYHDGTPAEFGFRSDQCMMYLMDKIRSKVIECREIAKENNLSAQFVDGCKIDLEAAKNAPPGWDASGCNPTRSLYSGGGLAPTFPDYGKWIKRNGCLCGGHVHFGASSLRMQHSDPDKNQYESWKRDENGMEHILMIVHALVVGVLPVVYRIAFDEWTERRFAKLGIGNFRLPPHGLEWKDPGSAIMRSPLTYISIAGLARVVVANAFGTSSKVDGCAFAPTAAFKKLISVDHIEAREMLHCRKTALELYDRIKPVLVDLHSSVFYNGTPFKSMTGIKLLEKAHDKMDKNPKFDRSWRLGKYRAEYIGAHTIHDDSELERENA